MERALEVMSSSDADSAFEAAGGLKWMGRSGFLVCFWQGSKGGRSDVGTKNFGLYILVDVLRSDDSCQYYLSFDRL